MTTVGIISDTHSYLDKKIKKYFSDCDQIWHAGDFGSVEVSDKLAEIAILKGVYGNIDGAKLRRIHPENQIFTMEGLKVFMTHIGGYPGKYTARVKALIHQEKPNIYICGHSHICKVIRDPKNNLIHINPGAAGVVGFHIMRTIVKMTLDKGKISDLKVIELGKRGSI